MAENALISHALLCLNDRYSLDLSPLWVHMAAWGAHRHDFLVHLRRVDDRHPSSQSLRPGSVKSAGYEGLEAILVITGVVANSQ